MCRYLWVKICDYGPAGWKCRTSFEHASRSIHCPPNPSFFIFSNPTHHGRMVNQLRFRLMNNSVWITKDRLFENNDMFRDFKVFNKQKLYLSRCSFNCFLFSIWKTHHTHIYTKKNQHLSTMPMYGVCAIFKTGEFPTNLFRFLIVCCLPTPLTQGRIDSIK